jgi:hypothetical protein
MKIGESSVQNFFPSVDDKSVLLISVHKRNYMGKRIHTFSSVNEQNEEEVLFRLREDIDPNLDNLPDGKDVLVLLTSMKNARALFLVS